MADYSEIDLSKLRRDYQKDPLVEEEYLTKEEFGYLYLELNWSFEEIDEYLGSKKGTALNKNRRKPGAVKSDKFGFKKTSEMVAAHMRKSFTEKTGLRSSMQREDVKEKVAKKNKERWKNNKEEILSKMKSTMVERYGVENPTQSEDLRNKAIQTKVEKYGNGNNDQKIKQTKLERYGDAGYLNHEKMKQTNFERYGYETPFGNEGVKEKSKHTIKERYGVDNVFQLDMFQMKAKSSRIESLSVPYFGERHITHFENYNKEFVVQNFVKDNYFLFDDALDYFNVNQSSLDAFKRRNEIVYPNKHSKHQMQNEVYDFIKTIYSSDVVCDTRKVIAPLELDIYVPEKNIAVEFDGLKYHSASCKEEDDKEFKFYHLKKTLMCREKGLKLFHVFENEWLDSLKKDIWKSVISNSLGVYDKVLYARDCDLIEVSDRDKKKFLEENHLQGNCASFVNLGLTFNGELVSLMTFGKPRFNNKFDYELLRFCSKKGHQVRFAASRLLHHFTKRHKGTIVSYANQRWSDGGLYKSLGFDLVNENVEPSYYYFTLKDKFLYSRSSFQKHMLKEKLNVFDETLTESENMFNNGFYKIYDCGSLTFVKK